MSGEDFRKLAIEASIQDSKVKTVNEKKMFKEVVLTVPMWENTLETGGEDVKLHSERV